MTGFEIAGHLSGKTEIMRYDNLSEITGSLFLIVILTESRSVGTETYREKRFETFANSPKSPKFPPRHLGDFTSTFFQQTAQAMIAKHIDRFPLLKLDQVIDCSRSNNTWIVKKPVTSETTAAVLPIPCCPCSKPSCPTMAQPLRSRTRTQPHYPHRFQPVLPFWRTKHPRLQHLMPLPQLAGARRHLNWIAGTD